MDLESDAAVPVVDICQGGEVIHRAACPKLLLPDGQCGVKWGGLVFPLRDGARVELTDPGTPPALCRPWTDPSLLWRLVAAGDDQDGYVFFDGDGAVRDRVLKKLAAAGVVVLRSGPNLSGTQGDWFARLERPGAQIQAVLENVLGAVPLPAENDTPLRERLLADALEAATAAREKLRVDLALAMAELESKLNHAQQMQNVQASLQAMATSLAEEKADAEFLRATVAQPLPEKRGTASLEKEFQIVAGILLPRLRMLRRSLQFLAVELSDRTSIWRALAQLDRVERGQPSGWKQLSGYPGWWEKHFSTGQDDQGRVYVKLLADRTGWQVLISHKQDQVSDLRSLRSVN